MVGAKLRQKKSRVQVLLALYVLLALTGGGLAARSVRAGQSVSGAAGFMMVFGLGMAVSTLARGRRVQVAVHADFVDVSQGRAVRTLRYRNMTAVSRPDPGRILVTLREDGQVRSEVIWTRDLEPGEVESLYDFLARRRGKAS